MLPSSLVAAYNAKAPFDGNAAEQGGLAGNGPAIGYDLHRAKNILKLVYNFATLGGAIGSVTLPDDQGNPVVLPAGLLIMRTYVFVVTAPVGSGASVAFSSGQTAADILAATAITSLTLNSTTDGIQTGTGANAKYITAACSPYATISGAALTAGVLDLFVEYVFT